MSNESQARKALKIIKSRTESHYGTPPDEMGIPGVKEVHFEDGSILEWGWGGWVIPWGSDENGFPPAWRSKKTTPIPITQQEGDAPELGGERADERKP
jgi:hypothetical protein